MGAIVKLSTKTIAITGNTAFNASSNFSVNLRLKNFNLSPLIHYTKNAACLQAVLAPFYNMLTSYFTPVY